MSETIQQYQQRLWGYLGDQDPLHVLKQTPARIKQLLRKSKQKRKQKTDRWTAAQVLAHLAEGEIILGWRLRMAASEPGTSIQAYDQNKWMANTNYLQKNMDAALELFITVRKINLAFLKALPAPAWEHYGVHSERGKETIRDMVRIYAGHDLNHLRQMKELMG